MSYTPPYASFVCDLGGVTYGAVHLALATLAYTYEDYPLSIASGLAGALSGLAVIPSPSSNDQLPTTAYWNLDWGPALCTGNGGLFNDNLVAIASYREGTGPNGTPLFFAVLCRGTDAGGGIGQISEDLDAYTQQSWVDVLNGSYTFGGATNGMTLQSATSQPIPSSAAGNIATGSADGLIAVSNLVEYSQIGNTSPQYLASALLSLLETYPGTPVVVTGHSLGGALTQLVAAYLSWQVSGLTEASQVIAQAFAPPTVGDSDFVSYYNGIFSTGSNCSASNNATGSYSQFWVNTADLVPCAFSQPAFNSAGGLWGAYFWPSNNGPQFGPTLFGTGSSILQQGERLTAQISLVTAIGDYLLPADAYERPASVQLLSANNNTLPSQTEMETFLTNEGANPAYWNTWTSVLMYQHLTPTYYSLVSAVSGVLSYPAVTAPVTPPAGSSFVKTTVVTPSMDTPTLVTSSMVTQ